MDNTINESDAFSFTEEDIAEEALKDSIQENIKHMLAKCYTIVADAEAMLSKLPDASFDPKESFSTLEMFSNSPNWCLFRMTCPKLWEKFTNVFYKKFKKD